MAYIFQFLKLCSTDYFFSFNFLFICNIGNTFLLNF